MKKITKKIRLEAQEKLEIYQTTHRLEREQQDISNHNRIDKNFKNFISYTLNKVMSEAFNEIIDKEYYQENERLNENDDWLNMADCALYNMESNGVQMMFDVMESKRKKAETRQQELSLILDSIKDWVNGLTGKSYFYRTTVELALDAIVNDTELPESNR